MQEVFTNKSLNKIHLHYGFVRFAENFTTTFGLIVLYQLGYLLWQVFFIWGSLFLLRFLMRFVVPKFLSKFGVKNTVLIGSAAYVFLFPIFYLASASYISFWIYFAFFSFTCVFYWYPFHILYGLIGDQEKRGRQSAIREGYAKIAYSLAPIFAGVILKYFDYEGLFIFGTVFFIFALLILLQVPEKFKIEVAPIKKAFPETSKRGFVMSLYFSFWEMFFDYLWIFVLFFLFDENTAYLGGILSGVMLLRIFIDYFIGKEIDFQKKIRWYQIGAVVIAGAVLGLTFLGFTLPTIAFFSSLLMLGYSLFCPYESVLIYNSIKESRHPEHFAFLAEAGWDFGTAVASFIIAFFVFRGADIRYLMPIGIVALPLTVGLYRSYFSRK